MARRSASNAGTLAAYLAMIDEAFDRKSWHGTTLRGSLREVTPEMAAWRPAPDRHNIHEVVVHAAYWKYAVARRLSGARRGSFVFAGSNWFHRPDEPSAESWKSHLRMLDDYHRQLRAVVEQIDDSQLDERPAGQEQTRAYMVRGIAAHDLYHTGQIQLLKKLYELRR